MKIVFSGLETEIWLASGEPHVLEIENRTLFTRICQSLDSGSGDVAPEPYSLWEGDEEQSPLSSLLMVSDPLHLPWEDKRLGGRLYSVFEGLMVEDEETRIELESISSRLSRAIAKLSHQVQADYEFGLEWGLKRYLKTLSFRVDRFECSRYLDSIISFLDFCSDMAIEQVLVFVNLKTFLSEKDLQEVYDRVFFHDFKVLLLESHHDTASYGHEKKTRVDLHFLESH